MKIKYLVGILLAFLYINSSFSYEQNRKESNSTKIFRNIDYLSILGTVNYFLNIYCKEMNRGRALLCIANGALVINHINGLIDAYKEGNKINCILETINIGIFSALAIYFAKKSSLLKKYFPI